MLYLKDKFKNTTIILASKSPRRQFLLGELGLEFDVIDKAEVDESYPAGLTKKAIPVYLAVKKSEALKDRLHDDTLIITADTIVWCKKKVLDKPDGRDDAIHLLSKLSGRKHQVITGVCLKTKRKRVTFYSRTSVRFRKLHKHEIIYYVDKYEPFDKAGAYGIQEWIGYIGVESIKGSYFNVMGLPVSKLYEKLISF